MVKQNNFRIIGALLIGFSVVAFALILNSMNKDDKDKDKLTDNSSDATARTQIAVSDNDSDGIQDWQEEFISANPIIFSSSTEEYTPPTTITGQTGVSFMQNTLSAKTYGSFGRSQDQITADTINSAVSKTAVDKIYTLKDIKVSSDISGANIRNYANAMASALLDNDDPTLKRGEGEILKEIANKGFIEEKDVKELQKLAKVYDKTIKDSLKVPVPNIFIKEHLDLINTYQALFVDISGFTKLEEDPIVALMRLKRYEDDTLGLNLAVKNIYRAIEPYAEHFKAGDSALIFASFSADFNI